MPGHEARAGGDVQAALELGDKFRHVNQYL